MAFPRPCQQAIVARVFTAFQKNRELTSHLGSSDSACALFVLLLSCCCVVVVVVVVGMTAAWNGLQFTRLPKAPRLLGFFNGFVAPAGRPLPCRTSLFCPQSRVLNVPPLRLSSLTGPLDALCCVSCQLVVPHDSVGPPPQPPIPPTTLVPPPDNEPPADWFSHGPLSIFPSLYGWGRGDPTPPGSGTQSWLFCPLISLGLALAESRLVSLPTPLVTVSRFLLSNLSSGPPTHSPSSVHTPITSTR